jgi:nucleotide-binding universal stress UspA family protein
LTELAEESSADVLVVGSCSPATQGRITPGRIGIRLMQGAPCAVALAPAGWRDSGRFRHVGIAFDGSPEAAVALAAGYSLAARDGAAVSLFFVLAAGSVGWTGLPPEEVDRGVRIERLRAQEQLDAAADAAPPGLNPRTVLLYGDPARQIATACDGIVDVVFAGSRGYGPLHRALAGSVSEALLLAATQPCIVTPRGEAPVAAGEASAGAASA